MTITKKLKYLHLDYDTNTKTLSAATVDPASRDIMGQISIPRHYMISLMRFGLRVLQAGKPRKKPQEH